MPSAIRIFVFRPSGASLEIPVLPPKFQISDGGTYTRQMSLGFGPTGFPGYRNIRGLSWDSFFPYQYDEGYCQYANLLHPMECVDFFLRSLDGTKTLGRPDILRVKITEEFEFNQIWPIVDDQFVIEDFTWDMDAGDLVDKQYSIKFKTLKIPSLRITDAQADVVPRQLRTAVYTPSTDRPDTSSVGVTTGTNKSVYVIRSGDSLSSIAASQLGDMSRWREIYNLNISLIGADPDLIVAGQILTMPGGASVNQGTITGRIS